MKGFQENTISFLSKVIEQRNPEILWTFFIAQGKNVLSGKQHGKTKNLSIMVLFR